MITHGADVEALRSLGERMRQGATTLETATDTVSHHVLAASWHGHDHALFVDVWDTQLAPALRAAYGALNEAGLQAVRNADEQDRTSAAYEGAAGPGATTGGNGSLPGASPDPGRDGAPADPSEGGGDKEQEPERSKDKGGDEILPEVEVGEVPLELEEFDPRNIDQGSLADCWFLASLGAVAAQDPQWLQDHISYDSEAGTYTVTFYDDGEPVDVTIDDDFTPSGSGDANGNPSWATVYEKAAAVFMGGDYTDVEYDSAAQGLEMITGQDSDTDGSGANPFDGPPDFDDMQGALDEGRPVVAFANTNRDYIPWDGPEDSSVVANHMYVVDGVNEDGEIVLINPWGPGGGTIDGDKKPGEIKLTPEEFESSFQSVTYGEAMSR